MPFAPGSPRVKVKAVFPGLLCAYASLVAFPPKEQDGEVGAVSVPFCLFFF